MAAESRNPIPHTKIYNGIITNGNNKIYGEKCDLVNNITITNAPIEKIKSISELVTFDNVKIYTVKTDDKTQYQNLILVGIKGNPEVNENKYSEYKDLLDTEVLDFNTNVKIATDDFTPIGN